MPVTVGKKYVVDGYVDDGYAEVILIEPLRTHIMFGKTTRVFPFRPNWASPVTESLEWRTEVLKARDATEQRRSLRQQPRRGIEYGILLQREMPTILESMLFGWQNKYFAVPVWTDRAKLATDALALDETLAVNTDTIGFQEVGYALIYYTERIYEVVQIASVGVNLLNLASPLEGDWPRGTLVFPLIVGHLNVAVPTTRHTSAVLSASVSFIGSADTAYPNVPDSSPVTMYDGSEVITDAPNWLSGISNEFTKEFDTVDAGVGPIAYFETEQIARVVRPFQWLLKNRAQIVAFRKLMGRMRGQAKSVWIASWNDDFEIAASNALDQSTLTIKGTAFHSLVGTNTSRDRVAIRLPNGTTVYRRITGTLPNYGTDTTTLTLDSTIGATVAPNDGSRTRLLLRCRLATDKIVIPWLTDGVANPQTTFVTVKL